MLANRTIQEQVGKERKDWKGYNSQTLKLLFERESWNK